MMFLACTAGGFLSVTPARADERFFTHIQDADVLPKGAWEFEQWLTLRQGHPGGDRQFDQTLWDFREEVEYGFTDRLSGAMYLNFRQDQVVANQPGLSDSSEFPFKGISTDLEHTIGAAYRLTPNWSVGLRHCLPCRRFNPFQASACVRGRRLCPP